MSRINLRIPVPYEKVLRDWLSSLDWSQDQFAHWLTKHGSPTSRATVSRWLSVSDRSDKSDCPSWPIAMLENHYQHGISMKRIVFANHKGGVGKSTLVCHQAFDLIRRGHRVLVVDLDDQGNSSLTLQAYAGNTVASSLFEPGARIPADVPDDGNILVIPGDAELVKLRDASDEVIDHFLYALDEVSSHFDYCVIDTPPSAGLFMGAALYAADYVVAPIELEQYSVQGIGRIMDIISTIRAQGNEDVCFMGMLPNRYDPRSPRQRDLLKDIRTEYPDYIIDAPIGIRSAIPEALDEGRPVWALKKTSARNAAKQISTFLDLMYQRMEDKNG